MREHVAQTAPQPPQQEANRAIQQTRAGQIEAQRRQKAAMLKPEEPLRAERILDRVEHSEVLERLTGAAPGWRLHLGGLITYSGFAMGPEYFRKVLHDQAEFRASVRGSTKSFYLMDTEFNMPSLADGHAFLNFYGVHRDYPRVDYYGPGPDSSRHGRTAFRLEDTSFEARGGVNPFAHLYLGGLGRYLLNNIGPGTDIRFASSDKVFTEQTTPGIQFQTNFFQSGAFLQYDWRDSRGNPHAGGNYVAQFSNYLDVRRGGYSFDRLDLEVDQYIPLFNRTHVIALRGKIEASDAYTGDHVPFYLQPTLGGPDDLRGFRAFRFYDNNAAILNGEYRWQVFHGMDMALFVDAGQVFDRWQQINLRGVETDYGFGFRMIQRDAVFLRIDTGFSREGFAIWFKFGNFF